MRRRLLFITMLAALAVCVTPRAAEAHPADRLLQHLIITIHGDRIEATFAVSGGLLATSELATSIDTNGDEVFSPEEGQAWLQRFTRQISITRAGELLPNDPAGIRLAMPAYNSFALGLSPLLVTFTLPTADQAQIGLRYAITNSYKPDLSDLRLDIAETEGGTLAEPAYPGRTVHLAVNVDPAVASGPVESAAEVANRWSATGVVSEAQALFDRPKTPWFIVLMLGIFAGMGALHAVQPGHGKTLVAAYLVATGGTPRDAMTLAGIVTATHTLSVYVLGMLTLLASEWFLPSRVIPVLSVVSGVLVAGMGAMMLWRATQRWRGDHARHHHHHAHDHDHDHAHDHHHHDHAGLSDEQHARLHAAEIDQVFVEWDGRRRVSFRQLLTLGVSGGIAPCPDALAILLLAAGIGQAAFGMVAIVAFSVGLALVLVAFGIAIALLRPALGRITSPTTGDAGWLARARTGLDRLVTVSPVVSAMVVFGLGLAMLWGVAA
jgi:ABC-type nickel/cobalt efflux system permease component RcnA